MKLSRVVTKLFSLLSAEPTVATLTMTSLLPSAFPSYRAYVDALRLFLRQHSGLFDFRSNDQKPVHLLIDHGYERRVPPEWREFFGSLYAAVDHNIFATALIAIQRGDCESLINITSSSPPPAHPPPPSLLEFMQNATHLLPAAIAGTPDVVQQTTPPEEAAASQPPKRPKLELMSLKKVQFDCSAFLNDIPTCRNTRLNDLETLLLSAPAE